MHCEALINAGEPGRQAGGAPCTEAQQQLGPGHVLGRCRGPAALVLRRGTAVLLSSPQHHCPASPGRLQLGERGRGEAHAVGAMLVAPFSRWRPARDLRSFGPTGRPTNRAGAAGAMGIGGGQSAARLAWADFPSGQARCVGACSPHSRFQKLFDTRLHHPHDARAPHSAVGRHHTSARLALAATTASAAAHSAPAASSSPPQHDSAGRRSRDAGRRHRGVRRRRVASRLQPLEGAGHGLER